MYSTSTHSPSQLQRMCRNSTIVTMEMTTYMVNIINNDDIELSPVSSSSLSPPSEQTRKATGETGILIYILHPLPSTQHPQPTRLGEQKLHPNTEGNTISPTVTRHLRTQHNVDPAGQTGNPPPSVFRLLEITTTRRVWQIPTAPVFRRLGLTTERIVSQVPQTPVFWCFEIMTKRLVSQLPAPPVRRCQKKTEEQLAS